MEKLTSINIEEGASAGNSFNGDNYLSCSYNSNRDDTSGYKVIKKIERETENLEQVTTINAPEVHRAGFSPTTFVPKTDETTDTLVESGPQNSSNKNQENGQLCDNIKRLNIPANQGRNNKSKENEDISVAPSSQSVPKAIMSESLSNLLAYGSSSEDSDSIPSLVDTGPDSDSEDELEESSNDGYAPDRNLPNDNVITTLGKYRENGSPNHDSESSDSDESSDTESDVGARSGSVNPAIKRVISGDRNGELGLDDLPPVPDLMKLDLNVKAEDCLQMGTVTSVVDRLVMVQSLPNTPAYDLDTLLFLDEGKRPLGHVYDVMGQVTSPMYVIRFNSKQEIESKGITKGLAVYSAPDTEHTQYVFLKQLMKMKGSDASWQGDNEVPPEFLDFSDDEAEYMFSKQSLNEQDVFDKKRKRNSVEKHKMFETAMNLRNKVDTARHKMRDSLEPTPKRYMPPASHPAFYYHPPNISQIRTQCSSTSFTNFPPPNFATPPPSFGYVNMGPAMFGMPPFGNQFGHGMPPFPPNPQPFPPPAFGPPTIPPLPAMPHSVFPQHNPAFSSVAAVMPTSIVAMHTAKQQQMNAAKSPKTPKTHQNGGVVPKAQPSGPKSRNSGLPKLYIPPQVDYQPPYPPNLGLPKSTVPPFATNPPPNIPVSMPPPFGPPMPPWPYNLPRAPHNGRGFQPHRGGGRPFKKQ